MLPVKLDEDPTWKLSPRHCGCQSQHMILTRMTLAPPFCNGCISKKTEQAIFLWIFKHPRRSSNIRADLQTSAQIFKHPHGSSNIRTALHTSTRISKHPHGSSNIRTDLQTSAQIFKHLHGSLNIRSDLQTSARISKHPHGSSKHPR